MAKATLLQKVTEFLLSIMELQRQAYHSLVGKLQLKNCSVVKLNMS